MGTAPSLQRQNYNRGLVDSFSGPFFRTPGWSTGAPRPGRRYLAAEVNVASSDFFLMTSQRLDTPRTRQGEIVTHDL